MANAALRRRAWQWAAAVPALERRCPPLPAAGARRIPEHMTSIEQAHIHTCMFIEAMSVARNFTQAILPVLRGVQQLRFAFRPAEESPPPFPGAFINWNRPAEFREGAETAYTSLLGALLRGEPPLAELRPLLADDVWRDLSGRQRQAEGAEAECGGGSAARVDFVHVMLASLGGPKSLEAFHEGHPPWAYARDPQLRETFARDMFRKSPLELGVAAVAQVSAADREGGSLWRLDWLTLRSEFDIVEGIRSPVPRRLPRPLVGVTRVR
ncbi:unnamed protein product [Prorocentrum cordatum]|uniref:Uncharacterized protein n=1 Tax=Prorocentrum cordatum TaxID=2364126 RepID=A0ABN9QQW7_9DINO|nr:unnamed protein product [Polarella glacialis]